MLKMIVYDYFDYFRWGNLKKHFSSFTMIWPYLYMLCLLPAIIELNESGRYGSYYGMTVAFLVVMTVLLVVPIKLPKQMHLCPMNRRERRKYLCGLFWLRFVMAFFVCMIGLLVAAVTTEMKPVIIAAEIFACLSFIICGSMTTYQGSVWGNENDKEKKRVKDVRLKGLYVLNIVGVIISAIEMIAGGLIGKDGIGFWAGLYIGISNGILFFINILVCRYYPTIIDIAIEYKEK